MTESPEPDDSAADKTSEPMKVDEPRQDIVEKDAGESTSTSDGEEPPVMKIDAPREDRVEFSQHDDADTTLAHESDDEPAEDSTED